jgi:biotin transport system substrate-specific component
MSTISNSLRISSPALRIALPLIGGIAITLASQLRVDLAFTPVPITGQTFAVILWGMLFGARQGAAAAATYLCAGALGLPVFAGFTSLTALWGPTAGYLVGFLPAAWIAGLFADRGLAKSFFGALVAAFTASLPIFILGTPVLALFVGWESVLMMGVVPFLVGNVIKSVLVASVVRTVR